MQIPASVIKETAIVTEQLLPAIGKEFPVVDKLLSVVAKGSEKAFADVHSLSQSGTAKQVFEFVTKSEQVGTKGFVTATETHLPRPLVLKLGGVHGTTTLEPVMKGALAMSVPNVPIAAARGKISALIGRELTFLKAWNPLGEAHVTVITPPELQILQGKDRLKPILTMERIGKIAKDMNIQSADLKIKGIGSGSTVLKGKKEETYFAIVKSNKLLAIRKRIFKEFVASGGDAKAWDPKNFRPHVTIGFTQRDLHEADGVLKDLTHTLDRRFIVSRH